MMTVDERAAYQKHLKDLNEEAKAITMPHGTWIGIRWNDLKQAIPAQLVVMVFSDITNVSVVEQFRGKYLIIETTVSERKKILGEGWEYGMEMRGVSRKLPPE